MFEESTETTSSIKTKRNSTTQNEARKVSEMNQQVISKGTNNNATISTKVGGVCNNSLESNKVLEVGQKLPPVIDLSGNEPKDKQKTSTTSEGNKEVDSHIKLMYTVLGKKKLDQTQTKILPGDLATISLQDSVPEDAAMMSFELEHDGTFGQEEQTDDEVEVAVRADEEDYESDSDSESDEEQECNRRLPTHVKSKVTKMIPVNIPDTEGTSYVSESLAEQLRNPEMLTLIDQLLEQKLKKHKEEEESKKRTTEPAAKQKGKTGKQTRLPVVKSPSQDTVYRPALNMRRSNNTIPRNEIKIKQKPVSQIESNINEILETYRRNEEQDGARASTSQHSSQEENNEATEAMMNPRNIANEVILEAEKFRANVVPPRGMELNRNHTTNHTNFGLSDTQNVNQLTPNFYGQMDPDDQFLHSTCHVDQNTMNSIAKTGFVEIEKLMPKRNFRPNDEKRMELVNRDGVSYFVPVTDKDSKIDSIKKWNIGFRIYATVYMRTHPHRSAEILQYIDIINMAASSFQWDNVAHYDNILDT